MSASEPWSVVFLTTGPASTGVSSEPVTGQTPSADGDQHDLTHHD